MGSSTHRNLITQVGQDFFQMQFDSDLNSRYENIYKDNSDTIVLDCIKYVPKSFFFYDVTSDTESLFNRYQATYFRKKFMKKKENAIRE